MDLNILSYLDYRELLHDWFWELKKANKKMSFRFVAKQLQLSSPNHFHLVISKKRHFSMPNFEKMLNLLKPNTKEKQYLKALFLYNRETSEEARKGLAEQLRAMRSNLQGPDLADTKYQIIGHTVAWYIKMAAMMFDGMTRAEVETAVLAACPFPIELDQLEQAFEVLTRHGVLTMKGNTCNFDLSDITTKWDMDQNEIKRHHMANLKLALETLAWPVQKRFFGSVTIPCNEETYESIVREIRSMSLRILEESNKKVTTKDQCQKVVTLHFSLFPYFEFP
ncbi:MAG: TIGR02147 family protein [Oligoflexales bacterium]